MSMSSRACRLVLVEAIYMSGELWAEMSAKEEAKVKSLKQKYKHKMAEAKVGAAIHDDVTCPLVYAHHGWSELRPQQDNSLRINHEIAV